MMQKPLLVPLFCRCLVPIPVLLYHRRNPNVPSAAFSSSEAIAFKFVSSDDDDKVGEGRFSKSLDDVPEYNKFLGIPSPSSSVPTVSDLSNNIHTAATLEGDGLIKHTFQLLGFIKVNICTGHLREYVKKNGCQNDAFAFRCVSKLNKSSDPNVAQVSSRFFIFKGFLRQRIHVLGFEIP